MGIRNRTFPLALAAGLAAFATPALAADYVQASGALSFASEYQGETFVGLFPGFSTSLSFDPAAPQAAKLDVTIPLTTADTKNGDRDSTLGTADFFNVARFATARYTASGFRSLGDNRYVADGTLELRGVKKPVALAFTWTPGANPVLQGRATVKRLDFGVGAGDWGDVSIIPDDVAISTKVTFRPAP
ncbi:YceI family protein [Luteimonas sp. MC1750]|uniref:YceI family protein n=1 Tax=Luteimonas sp. MC1750 TaxID=2799326 RepID=UPI0018F0EDEA|nr:YceI family protein [Luteimonas sp. MC1750]MBJ6985017.1 YceI family protein [Luteimonas sp. MC1750]QQO05685.1 YceI family protein [Luteimonas sp. MC1750]